MGAKKSRHSGLPKPQGTQSLIGDFRGQKTTTEKLRNSESIPEQLRRSKPITEQHTGWNGLTGGPLGLLSAPDPPPIPHEPFDKHYTLWGYHVYFNIISWLLALVVVVGASGSPLEAQSIPYILQGMRGIGLWGNTSCHMNHSMIYIREIFFADDPRWWRFGRE